MKFKLFLVSLWLFFAVAPLQAAQPNATQFSAAAKAEVSTALAGLSAKKRAKLKRKVEKLKKKQAHSPEKAAISLKKLFTVVGVILIVLGLLGLLAIDIVTAGTGTIILGLVLVLIGQLAF